MTCRDASARAASAGCFPHSGLPPGTSCRVWVAKRCAKRGNGAWVVSVRRTSRYAAKIVCRCVRPYQSDVVPVQKNRLKRRRLASLRGVFAAPCEVSRGSSRDGSSLLTHARNAAEGRRVQSTTHYSVTSSRTMFTYRSKPLSVPTSSLSDLSMTCGRGARRGLSVNHSRCRQRTDPNQPADREAPLQSTPSRAWGGLGSSTHPKLGPDALVHDLGWHEVRRVGRPLPLPWRGKHADRPKCSCGAKRRQRRLRCRSPPAPPDLACTLTPGRRRKGAARGSGTKVWSAANSEVGVGCAARAHRRGGGGEDAQKHVRIVPRWMRRRHASMRSRSSTTRTRTWSAPTLEISRQAETMARARLAGESRRGARARTSWRPSSASDPPRTRCSTPKPAR